MKEYGFALGIESTDTDITINIGETLYHSPDGKGFFCEWTAHEGVSTDYVHCPHFYEVVAHYPREGNDVAIHTVVDANVVVAEALKYNISATKALNVMMKCLKDKTV